ncbi:MAG: hypothetical protein PUE85_10510 [Firmicutes bacterium]|nr:hypothetical protein [Bacillota bacterium]
MEHKIITKRENHVCVRYPVFDNAERVGNFCTELAERACASKTPFLTDISCSVTLCTEERLSFFFDVRCFDGNTLASIRRISQSWERIDDSFFLIRMKNPDFELKKRLRLAKINRADGFYLTPSATVYYENTFREGDGAGLRRSEYLKFILTEIILSPKSDLDE